MQVEQILHAARELDSLSAGVLEAIERISRIVEQNSAATEEMSAQAEQSLAAAQSLAEMSETMARSPAVFKIEAGKAERTPAKTE